MISVNNLTYAYPRTDKPAIQSLNFEVADGEIFGFLGPSGAGKSTTQKILNGLLQGYQGAINVLGREVRDWQSDYYEKIGVSFELPNHYLKLSARENLTYFGALYQGATRPPQELLEMVGLGNDGDLLVSQYSKGMKNRLSVARSLLHDPQLLFFDEPTAGLDPVNARRIKELIMAQKEAGRTVFLTTHDMTVAGQLCDRVAFIVDGQINLIESPQSLQKRYGKAAVEVTYGGAEGEAETAVFDLPTLATNKQFLEVVQTRQIQTIHTQEATLEDVFIQVTGRSLS